MAEKKKGVSQVFVYEHIIRDMFLISFSTFNRWLAYPAKQELRNGKKPEANRKQLSLSFGR
mgnify:CR=1 FL=1